MADTSSEQVNQDQDSEQSFEENLDEIDQILEKLQDGDLELESSLELYEEAISLLRNSKEILDETERKIEVLREEGEQIISEPFSPEEESE